jgi:hypothetical protein
MSTQGKNRSADALDGKVEAPIITEFVLGENLFQSDGYSTIKVTKAGKSVISRLPIRSIGVIELKDRMEKDAPKPPKKLKKIFKNSDLAKELGIDKDGYVEVFDFADPTYVKESEEFRTSLFWQMVVLAINAEFVNKVTGEKITDYKQKMEILKSSGITSQHLDQILTDVMRLTADSEGTADFLSGKSWV